MRKFNSYRTRVIDLSSQEEFDGVQGEVPSEIRAEPELEF